MGYTEFYEGAAQSKSRMKVKDLFSDSFKKHSRTDMEYALAAGSIYDRADGETMLVKWSKPWLWLRVFLVLLAISAANYGMIRILISMELNYPVFGWTLVMFSTLVTPLTAMVFIWELNVPRNISIMSMGLYFVIGGMLSIFFTVFFNLIDWGDGAWLAPFAEEPAKLAATFLLIYLFSKKGKDVFGVTGLVIGAAVGTGFTVFETYQYAYNAVLNVAQSMSQKYGGSVAGYIEVCSQVGLQSVFLRSFPHLCGHLLYCAPYSAAFALTYHKNKSWGEAFSDLSFWGVFASSCALHAIWNSRFNTGWGTECIIALCSFVIIFFIIRKCFRQVINEGKYSSGDKDAGRIKNNQNVRQNIADTPAVGTFTVTGGCRKADGSMWSDRRNGTDRILVGRDPSCTLIFPFDINGVSRRHCIVSRVNGQYYVQDLGSSCGTFINGKRLSAQESVCVNASDKIYLGSALAYIKIG